MQTTFHSLIRTGGAFAAITLALASAQLSAADTDAFPKFESYIKISGQAPKITGDTTAFQARTNQAKNGGFGIEDLYIAKDLTKDTALTVNGHALTQSEDYLLSLKLAKNELGSVDVGYKSYRTFYDGVGGFFPISRSFNALKNQDLSIDRGEFWASIKVARPDSPEFELRYTDKIRTGQKDSISWGDSDNSGLIYRMMNGGLSNGGVSNSNATVRKNTPSVFNVDEHHRTLEGIVKHKLGDTNVQLTLIDDRTSKNNFHWVNRFPGETLGVLPGETVITAPVALVTPAAQWLEFNNQVIQNTYDIQNTATKGATFTTDTELSPKLTLQAALGYEWVSATSSGDRWTVSNSPVTGNVTRTLTAYAVRNLAGNSHVQVWTGKLALDYKVSDKIKANLALRGEKESASGDSGFDTSSASAADPSVITWTSRLQTSEVDEKSVTPVLDLRYSENRDLALYMTVSDKIGKGTDVQTPAYNPVTTTTQSVIYRDVTEDKLAVTVGANWRASSALSLRVEPFYKKNSFQATGWNTNTNAPAAPTLDNNYELDSKFVGFKLTAVARPLDVLSLTARYIYQKGEMEVTGFLALYPTWDSMDSKMHDIGVTLDWNPSKDFYAQASADVVFNVISTVSLHNYGLPAAGTIPTNLLVQNADNNYSTVQLLAGAVITKTDDLQVQFNYYKADNYNPLMALYTTPYGAGARETSATVGIKHKFSDNFIGNFKVGYFDSENDTTGTRTNYKGPMAYFSLEHAL